MSLRDRLHSVYRRVPKLECQGLCHKSCGVIPASNAELQVIEETHGRALSWDPETLECGFLKDERCSIYADRPLICRLFGAVEKVQCPHGCRPKRWLPEKRARQLLDDAERLGKEEG